MSNAPASPSRPSPETPPPPKLSDAPTPEGWYGPYGGSSAPPALAPGLEQLGREYARASQDRSFWETLKERLRAFVGRPTPLYRADGLTGFVRSNLPRSGGKPAAGAVLWLKREDIGPTGGHQINNAIAQAMLAVRMDKRRLIAPAASGAQAFAAGSAAAHFGLACEVYMGARDIGRQPSCEARLRCLGARLIGVESGGGTFRDATREAMRAWSEDLSSSHALLGSAVGPHPFPLIIRDVQSIIGRETKAQSLRLLGKLPEVVVAEVGEGGCDLGLFFPFLEDVKVQLVGVQGGGQGTAAGQHAASLLAGGRADFQGCSTLVLLDEAGQPAASHSCAPGLDIPGAPPEHASWKESNRVRYAAATDAEALDAFATLCRTEGIIPSLESAHALVEAMKIAASLPGEANVVVALSAGGGSDLDEAVRRMPIEMTAGRDQR